MIIKILEVYWLLNYGFVILISFVVSGLLFLFKYINLISPSDHFLSVQVNIPWMKFIKSGLQIAGHPSVCQVFPVFPFSCSF